ncbi:hypothetical protein GGR55DRAFT_618619 [Xylaria sp. FL0064]|nr:hypothetical protein GGR55DRAFT_618619 [Xylaria sp. FL0064]
MKGQKSNIVPSSGASVSAALSKVTVTHTSPRRLVPGRKIATPKVLARRALVDILGLLFIYLSGVSGFHPYTSALPSSLSLVALEKEALEKALSLLYKIYDASIALPITKSLSRMDIDTGKGRVQNRKITQSSCSPRLAYIIICITRQGDKAK